MAHAAPPGGHLTATQMKATARVQSEAMLDMLKTAKLHTAIADVRSRRRGAAACQCTPC